MVIEQSRDFWMAFSCLHSRFGPSADIGWSSPRGHTHVQVWCPAPRPSRIGLRVGSVPSPGLEVWVPSEHLVVFDGESFDTAACEEMLSSATVRPLAHALRLQTPASRLSASPVRFASSLAGRRRDPHEVLGVMPGVSKCELKKAFHRSSWSWHPDRATPSDRPAAEVRPRIRSKPLAAPPDWSGSAHTACSLSPRSAASLQGTFGGLSQAERPRGWARGTRELAV